MFENILFQDAVCEELRGDIQSQKLAQSLLLSGPQNSGKTALALELARVLSCVQLREQGLWSCNCWSCAQNRELVQPFIVLIGPSEFTGEIAAARRNFSLASQRKEFPALRISFIIWLRGIRKILKRFSPELQDQASGRGESDRKSEKILGECIEQLDLLCPPTLQFQNSLSSWNSRAFDRVQELARTLAQNIPKGIPVQQVRQLHRWVHLTSQTVKISILEHVDTMSQGAVSAMLKLLEEPPPNCYFILTTRSRKALPPTLLSRLRTFALKQRSDEEEQQIVKRVFQNQEPVSLCQLFSGDPHNSLEQKSRLFLRSLRQKKPYFLIRKEIEPLELEPFLRHVGRMLRKGALSSAEPKEWTFLQCQQFLKQSGEAVNRYKTYHDPSAFLLENLYRSFE